MKASLHFFIPSLFFIPFPYIIRSFYISFKNPNYCCINCSSWQLHLRNIARLCQVLVALLRPTLCNPRDCSLPGSSVHGILHTRILQWVAIPFPRGSSQPRDPTPISYLQAGSLPPGKPIVLRLDLEAIKKRLSLKLCKLVGQGNLKKQFMRTSRFQKSKPVTCFVSLLMSFYTERLYCLNQKVIFLDYIWLQRQP